MSRRVVCLSVLFVGILLGLQGLARAQERFNMSHSAMTGSQAILFVTKELEDSSYVAELYVDKDKK